MTFSGSLSPLIFASVVAASVLAEQAAGVEVSLVATDSFGNSSFDTAAPNAGAFTPSWNSNSYPQPGDDYITGNFVLRTPDDGGSYTFSGDSLKVNNTNDFQNGGFWYKGTGGSGVITVNNLILDGGIITHQNGPTDVFNLAGSIDVVSDSQIFGRQGPINISATISGAATITNPGSGGVDRIVRFMSPNNTFRGNVVNEGRFELSENAAMHFEIGPSDTNNVISGGGAVTNLAGRFAFDLSNAGDSPGDSWQVVTATNASFEETFVVDGFSELPGGVWQYGAYRFTESTGMLAVTEPLPMLKLEVYLNGIVRLVNPSSSSSVAINYYELHSPSGSLDAAWSGIDGNATPTEFTWEQGDQSNTQLLLESNLFGEAALGPLEGISVGTAYAGGAELANQDLRLLFGIVGGSTLLPAVETVYIAGTPGDFNSDGAVNLADYTIWRDHLGAVEDGLVLNGNGDGGLVTASDYELWKTNFGNTTPASALGDTTTAVPEPSGLLFIVPAIVCCVCEKLN